MFVSIWRRDDRCACCLLLASACACAFAATSTSTSLHFRLLVRFSDSHFGATSVDSTCRLFVVRCSTGRRARSRIRVSPAARSAGAHARGPRSRWRHLARAPGGRCGHSRLASRVFGESTSGPLVGQYRSAAIRVAPKRPQTRRRSRLDSGERRAGCRQPTAERSLVGRSQFALESRRVSQSSANKQKSSEAC